MIRIICIGNRHLDGDAAGPQVYDQLAGRELPDGVEVVDGSLSEHNLLELVQECERVVFVDDVTGFGKPGEVMLIDDLSKLATRPDSLDNGDGLSYLLSIIDQVVRETTPEILVIGLEAPCTETALWRATEMSVVEATRKARPQEQNCRMKRDLIA